MPNGRCIVGALLLLVTPGCFANTSRQAVYERLLSEERANVTARLPTFQGHKAQLERMASTAGTTAPTEGAWNDPSVVLANDVSATAADRINAYNRVIESLEVTKDSEGRPRILALPNESGTARNLRWQEVPGAEELLLIESVEEHEETKKLTAIRAEEAHAALESFKGLGFSLGLAVSIDFGGRQRVDDAENVNGTLRVKAKRSAQPRIMLEAHYLALPDYSFLGLVEKTKWGIGPFVGIQTNADEALLSYSTGVLLGFKPVETSGSAFNIGAGVILDPNAKFLGGGLRDGQAMAAGEEVRFREDSRWGALFMVSFKF